MNRGKGGGTIIMGHGHGHGGGLVMAGGGKKKGSTIIWGRKK